MHATGYQPPRDVNIMQPQDDAIPTSAKSTCKSGFDTSYLMKIRAQSCSRGNFATNLMKKCYSDDERVTSNVRGSHQKHKLSPKRMLKIKNAVFEIYPLTQRETEKEAWADCVRAIDTSNRTLSRKKKSCM